MRTNWEKPMPLPPPSSDLLARVTSMQPVKTRVPARTLVGVAALSLLYGALAFVVRPLRDDLPYLSTAWVALFGTVWLIGFVAPLVAAIVPRPGTVLPDVVRACRVAAVVAAALIAIGLVLTRGAPGYTPIPDQPLRSALSCVLFSLEVWAGVVVVGLIALRRVVTFGSWRTGAAIGAAGGALAG